MLIKIAFLKQHLNDFIPWLYIESYWWTVFGVFGNILFTSRFLFQWLHSEIKKKLIVPWYFWYISFVGSVINLIYSFHVDKLPFILGFVFLPFLYARNIVLLHRK